MKAVIDASVMGPMLVPDEEHDRFEDVLALVTAGEAIVPQHWPLEIANICRSAIKRGRLTEQDSVGRLDDVRRLAVAVDEHTIPQLWRETMVLALKHDLTPYDAAYLELAKRRDLALFSHDRKLHNASLAERVSLF